MQENQQIDVADPGPKKNVSVEPDASQGWVLGMDRERDAVLEPKPAWRVEVDRASPAEWSQMLSLFSDSTFYQTWSYGAVRWGSKNLSHLVLKRDGDVMGMAQLRIVRPTRFKFGMAYLRWGPVFERHGQQPEAGTTEALARALEQEYLGKRRLLMRILPNAFAGSPRAAIFEAAFARFTPEPLVPDNTYRTLVLNLAPSLEELRRKLDKKWRNQLSFAERNGLTVRSGSGIAEFEAFSFIYKEMRRRKSFESTVDIDEFASMQRDLPEPQRMRVLICEQRGVPAAGLVASALGDTAIYLLGATSDQGLNTKGAYLLQWSLIKWLKDQGVRWYDLGGIDPEQNPGVYHFKRGISGVDICQISPLVASNSSLSTAAVKAGLALQRGLRGVIGNFSRARNLKQSGTSA